MQVKLLFIIFLLLTTAFSLSAQTAAKNERPSRIRGYKIYKAKVKIQIAQEITPAGTQDEIDSLVKIGTPQNFRLTFGGATFELPLSMNIYKTGGRVDTIAFENAQAGGMKMQIEEFNEPFDFAKGIDKNLPRPLRIKIDLAENSTRLLQLKPSLDHLEVAGRVLVFGTFKKFGMKFKRVIPIDFKFKIKFPAVLNGLKGLNGEK